MDTGPLSQLRCWSMSFVWRLGTAIVPGNLSTQMIGEPRPNPFLRDDSAGWGSPQGLLPWEEALSRRLLCVTGGRAVSVALAYDSWAWATSWPVLLRLPLTFTNSGAFSCSSCNFCFSSSSCSNFCCRFNSSISKSDLFFCASSSFCFITWSRFLFSITFCSSGLFWGARPLFWFIRSSRWRSWWLRDVLTGLTSFWGLISSGLSSSI